MSPNAGQIDSWQETRGKGMHPVRCMLSPMARPLGLACGGSTHLRGERGKPVGPGKDPGADPSGRKGIWSDSAGSVIGTGIFRGPIQGEDCPHPDAGYGDRKDG